MGPIAHRKGWSGSRRERLIKDRPLAPESRATNAVLVAKRQVRSRAVEWLVWNG